MRHVALPFAALILAAVGLRVFRAEPPPAPPPARIIEEAVVVAAPEAEPVPVPAPTPPAPVTFVEPVLSASELLPLIQARFSDETILAVARVSGRPFKATPDERAALREAGMSDALLGRLSGEAPAVQAAPPPAPIYVPVTVYAPVTVTTVIEAPPPPPPAPEPFISSVILTCVHGRLDCCPAPSLERPAIYGKPPFFKTHTPMPTKPAPTAEEVQRQQEARSTRIFR